ncbi:PEP-CTERM sorting domain-containing protein [Massilia sp. Root335]|uniref:PEP-CTERM sorting domain-containing protein n=1 Tax=Massilia sp. Root335 TaxID=1736517 RepID=UPI0006F5E4B6|nr:PEP-CTERM sorting domain-containing protein [Massilia sp. Root335]KQV45177.1 hypothetical protein ASC93_01100 [Massilia sp. Root335]
MRIALPLLAALAALAASPSALAQVQGTAEATNLRYSLTDLTPADGLAPAVNFTNGQAVALSVQSLLMAPGTRPDEHIADVTATAPTTLSRNWTPEVHVDASLGRLGVRTALTVDTVPDAFTRGSATATLAPWYFTLAPHTGIAFSFDVAIAMALDEGANASEYGGANAFATLYYRTASGAWSAPIVDGLFGSAGTSQAGVFAPFDLTRTATVSWANTGDTWIEGHVIYDVGVSGEVQGGPAPVPEPAGWAMLAAGVGLLGAVARRQRI